MATKKNRRAGIEMGIKREANKPVDKFELAEAALADCENDYDKTSNSDQIVTKEKTINRVIKDGKINKVKNIKKVKTDTFSFPIEDHDLIAKLMKRANKEVEDVLSIKKSEVVRAGLRLLSNASKKDFIEAIEGVERVQTGRKS